MSVDVWLLALNEIRIKLTSLIICSINDTLTTKSSTSPSEVHKKPKPNENKKKRKEKKKSNKFIYLNRNLHLLEI